MKLKITIHEEERYPVYEFEVITNDSDSFDKKWSIHVPENKIRWLEKVEREYDKAQKYLQKKHEELYKE